MNKVVSGGLENGFKKEAAREKINKIAIVLVLAGLVVFFSIASDTFFSTVNFTNILKQVSVNGIVAIGMTFVILSGGIDLSVGSIVALAGVITASIAKQANDQWPLAIFAAIGIAMLMGAINGVLVAYFKVVPFIQTMAMMSIARGLTMMYANGKPISDLHHSFTAIGKNDIGGIPVIVLIFVAVFVIGCIYLYKTKMGKHIYAVGGNETASYISGINTRFVTFSVYMISGLLCGIAAIVLTSRVASGLPRAGEGYELDAIASAVIGGTSLTGGKGSLFGTLVGILIIGVLNNGLDLMGVSSYLQSVIKGIIIIIAVLIDKRMEKN